MVGRINEETLEGRKEGRHPENGSLNKLFLEDATLEPLFLKYPETLNHLNPKILPSFLPSEGFRILGCRVI
jgi:hypothetical protein